MSQLSKVFDKAILSIMLESLLRVRAGIEEGHADESKAMCMLTSDYWCDNDVGLLQREALCRLRRYLYRSWPKFSGNSDFPVPGAGDKETDEIAAKAWVRDRHGPDLDFGISSDVAEAYFDAVHGGGLNGGNMWAGAYGNLRRELLQFMIDELQKDTIA